MKTCVLPYAIRYYLPWLSAARKKLSTISGNKGRNLEHTRKANARYCYSVWLRHLSVLNDHGLLVQPGVVAELGPGDSIGVGLMALLTGAKKYYAFDVVNHTTLAQNVGMVDDLIELLVNRESIPDEKEFPRVYPRLHSYDFPCGTISKNRISDNLENARIEKIKEVLLQDENRCLQSQYIEYFCPWYEESIISPDSVDMIYSQAALEHVDNLQHTYEAMYLWLKKGGVMSHQIDFNSHGTSNTWNGHWAYSDVEWKLIAGRQAYCINREPLSAHIDIQRRAGFTIIAIIPEKTYPSDKYNGALKRKQIVEKYRHMTDEDFTTCSAHIISKKSSDN